MKYWIFFVFCSTKPTTLPESLNRNFRDWRIDDSSRVRLHHSLPALSRLFSKGMFGILLGHMFVAGADGKKEYKLIGRFYHSFHCKSGCAFLLKSFASVGLLEVVHSLTYFLHYSKPPHHNINASLRALITSKISDVLCSVSSYQVSPIPEVFSHNPRHEISLVVPYPFSVNYNCSPEPSTAQSAYGQVLYSCRANTSPPCTHF